MYQEKYTGGGGYTQNGIPWYRMTNKENVLMFIVENKCTNTCLQDLSFWLTLNLSKSVK